MRKPRIAVVRDQGDFILSRQEGGDFKDVRRADRRRNKIRDRGAVDFQAEAAGALAFQEHAFSGGKSRRNGTGDPGRAFPGKAPRKPGGDAPALLHRVVDRRVRMPLVVVLIREPDSAFVQRSGQPHRRGHSRNAALPDAAQVLGRHGIHIITAVFLSFPCFLWSAAAFRTRPFVHLLSGTSVQSCRFIRSYSSSVMARMVPCLNP